MKLSSLFLSIPLTFFSSSFPFHLFFDRKISQIIWRTNRNNSMYMLWFLYLYVCPMIYIMLLSSSVYTQWWSIIHLLSIRLEFGIMAISTKTSIIIISEEDWKRKFFCNKGLQFSVEISNKFSLFPVYAIYVLVKVVTNRQLISI